MSMLGCRDWLVGQALARPAAGDLPCPSVVECCSFCVSSRIVKTCVVADRRIDGSTRRRFLSKPYDTFLNISVPGRQQLSWYPWPGVRQSRDLLTQAGRLTED